MKIAIELNIDANECNWTVLKDGQFLVTGTAEPTPKDPDVPWRLTHNRDLVQTALDDAFNDLCGMNEI